jgi:hypothetical protein
MTNTILFIIVLINNLFLISLVFALLPKRVRRNFPQRPVLRVPNLKKRKKEEYHFLEEVPVKELNKELFKK